MIGVVFVAHGGLADHILATVEHILGPQRAMVAIAIGPEDDRSAKQAEICRAADEVDQGQGVVIVTDMFGGSPSNLSMRACHAPNRQILYGANIPMAVQLARSRRQTMGQAVLAAREAGRKYMGSYEP